MCQIKQLPEDFLVTEISNIEIKEESTIPTPDHPPLPSSNSNKYLYYKLIKKDWNTLDAVKRIALLLNVKEKQIGFAGSKDRKAITEQIISFQGVRKEQVDNIKLNGIELHFLGCGNKPISLGDLEGNKFEIVVRNLNDEEIKDISNGNEHVSSINTANHPYIPNYFDEQRFGLRNVSVGRHLVKKQFGKAVITINDPHYIEYLKDHQNDFIGALKKIPTRLLRMYINSYQSYLWNETLVQYLHDHGIVEKTVEYSLGRFVFVKNDDHFLDLKIPLIGFGSQELENTETHDIIKYLMQKEEISYDDFIIKQIPELSLEGELRKCFVKVKDLKVGELEDDELNAGKKKVLIKFTLPKGSYATMVVRKLFG